MQLDSKAVSADRSRTLARYRRFCTVKIIGGACSALGVLLIQALLYAAEQHF